MERSFLSPVALQEITHKLVTFTVASRLAELLFEFQLIDPNHFGFVKGGSVDTPIAILVRLFEKAQALHKKPHDGHDVHTLLVDLVSAFDNVPHALIELKLKKMGAPEAFCHWIRNLIHKQTRFCSTAFNPGDPNDTMTLQGGVPQGCPLSPILFVIFFDIVISSLHTTLGDTGCSLGAALIQSILFGDDTTGAAPNSKDLQGPPTPPL